MFFYTYYKAILNIVKKNIKIKLIFLTVCAVFFIVNITNAQLEKASFSLQKIDSLYLEDQLFFSVFFNNLITNNATPKLNEQISYGIETGFIKDIPLSKNRDFGLGIGLGYGYQQMKNNLFSEGFLQKKETNRIFNNRFHSIEIPLEVRWRSSTAKKYKFWRLYTGVKFSYTFSKKINEEIQDAFNPFNVAATSSFGNGLINFRVVYYITSIIKNDADKNPHRFKAMPLQLGLVFFVL